MAAGADQQIPSYDGAPPAKPPATPVRRPDDAPFVNQDALAESTTRANAWTLVTNEKKRLPRAHGGRRAVERCG